MRAQATIQSNTQRLNQNINDQCGFAKCFFWGNIHWVHQISNAILYGILEVVPQRLEEMFCARRPRCPSLSRSWGLMVRTKAMLPPPSVATSRAHRRVLAVWANVHLHGVWSTPSNMSLMSGEVFTSNRSDRGLPTRICEISTSDSSIISNRGVMVLSGL